MNPSAFILDIIGIIVGLIVGGVGGYAMGVRWRQRHATLWAAGIAAFVGASLLNFVGRWLGIEWLSFGSLGLMAGVLSGVKYGGFPDVRIWETQPQPKKDEPADEGVPPDEGEPIDEHPPVE